MTPLIVKLRQVAQDILAERGGIALFALFEREGTGGKWDIVLAADWVQDDEQAVLRYFIHKARNVLAPTDFASISAFVALKPMDHFAQFVLQAVGKRTDYFRVANWEINGMMMVNAVILYADPSLSGLPEVSPFGTPNLITDLSHVA